jgi:phosphohistidine swiveling domain-containing protein
VSQGFAVADCADPGQVGGKAAGLASLEELAMPVPPFRVLPQSLFRAHLLRGGIPAALGETMLMLADLESGDAAARTVVSDASALLRSAVETAEPAPSLREVVTTAVEELGAGPYAVRSSMVGEDSTRHSFAGQLESQLFVTSADEVVDAVRVCWGSAFGEPALSYGTHAGISPAEVRMAVVIQRMVDAETSGVVFTANPVSGRHDECLVSASFGLGEGVVAGIALSDEYVWAADRERSATVPHKDVQVIRSTSRSGTEEAAVPEALRERRVLPPERVAEVARLALLVAASAGRPMDIEWCYAEGNLWVLQARPITSLRAAADEPIRTYDNSNIQENYNGVTTPLTFSFSSRAYATVFRALLRTLGVSDRSLAEFEPSSRTLLGFVQGRIYYNLESWDHQFSFLPGGSRRTEEVTKVMWHTQWEGMEAGHPEHAQRLRRKLEAAGVGARMLWYVVRLDREVDRFMAYFDSVYASVDRDAVRDMSLSDLYATSHRLYAQLLDHWDTPNINDLRVVMSCGRIHRLLEGLYEGDAVDSRLADLLGGIDGIESTAPTLTLLGIAKDARDNEDAVRALRASDPAEALARLHKCAPELGMRLDRYVELYGDRTVGELMLETIPMRDNPAFLVGVLRNYLDRPDIQPESLVRSERQRYDEARAEIEARLPHWRRAVLRREVKLARTAVKAREALRLRRTRAFGLARDVYMAMGVRLHEAGFLDDPRDVVYLTVDELEAFVEGRAASTDLAATVAARRTEYARYEFEPEQNRFTSAGSPYLGVQPASNSGGEAAEMGDSSTLRGLGCCAGVVEAPVRLIFNPHEAPSVNGQILCTVRTDPGWAPLFPTVSGLIVERGSPLSHSAVVAREFGIPTVVGVPDVTRILIDGEIVRMDGAAGLVQRLENGAPAARVDASIVQSGA